MVWRKTLNCDQEDLISNASVELKQSEQFINIDSSGHFLILSLDHLIHHCYCQVILHTQLLILLFCTCDLHYFLWIWNDKNGAFHKIANELSLSKWCQNTVKGSNLTGYFRVNYCSKRFSTGPHGPDTVPSIIHTITRTVFFLMKVPT